MTEQEAYALIDFFYARLHGWDIVIASATKSGFIDCRTRQTKRADMLQTDIVLHSPEHDELVAAVMNGHDIAMMWPPALAEVVRFRIWHVVPREYNEPLSPHGRKLREEVQGLDPWPDIVEQYSRPATAADHPPFPPLSELYMAWKAGPEVAA